jgi:hypothetical protein
MSVTEQAPGVRHEHRLYWWKEAVIMAAFYAVYSFTRNLFGSNRIAADGAPENAFHNAERVIRWQRAIGLYHEETIQDWFLSHRAFVQFWNVFYGTAHFFVTIGVFIVLFRRRKHVFAVYRNALAVATGLAILGFAFFPLMPPRLLDVACSDYGGACIASSLRGPTGFGFVDTLREYGGPWSFDSEAMASISNQYAAMPSLHVAWSTWCALAMWPLLRTRWSRAAVLVYPAATFFCIIVTGNHYWIDGVGGLLCLAVGLAAGRWMHERNQRRLARRATADETE